ncbi:MAG: HD domain-containing phosphohydrolase [Candidatus Omnitrophota bacterium]|jgi:HD-GYP domain-containing protein (c-di-GMP phosphodiesterase class II)
MLSRSVDYKKELELAAKNMILVHEPDVLIKLIVRMVVNKLKISHAAIMLHKQGENIYVSTVSRGPLGLKMPQGFIRMDTNNALVSLCSDVKKKKLLKSDAVVYEDVKKMLKRGDMDDHSRGLFVTALQQMEIFEATVCIPSFFHHDLLALLFLGRKKNKQRFHKDELDFIAALASDVAMAIRNAQLFQSLKEELEKKHQLFLQTSIALAAAIDAKDHYTHNHIMRVADLSLAIAGKISRKYKVDFSDQFLEDLKISSLLHDIGKIGVPGSILNKQGPLTPEERQKIQDHPLIGIAILEHVKDLENAAVGVKYHHERYDGTGYPQGLKGEDIPIMAAIIAVADSFDAMTTDRPYRSGLSKEATMKEIERLSGLQFHPQAASAIIELYHEGKI